MKTNILFVAIIISLILLGCDKHDDDSTPLINVTYNGLPEKDILLAKGSTGTIQFEVNSSTAFERIEIYQRNEISGKPQLIETVKTFEGLHYSKSIAINALTTDVSYSMFVLDADGNYSNAQINLLLDVQEFYNVTLTAPDKVGITKTFFSSKNGTPLHYAVLNTDVKNLDFGFVRDAANNTLGGAFISVDEYHKSGNYAQIAGVGAVSFKKASGALYNSSADIKNLFDQGQSFAAVTGYTSIAPNLVKGDVVAMKNVHGKYVLIKITDLTAISVKFDAFVQR
jgi:hypothetical protein